MIVLEIDTSLYAREVESEVKLFADSYVEGLCRAIVGPQRPSLVLARPAHVHDEVRIVSVDVGNIGEPVVVEGEVGSVVMVRDRRQMKPEREYTVSSFLPTLAPIEFGLFGQRTWEWFRHMLASRPGGKLQW